MTEERRRSRRRRGRAGINAAAGPGGEFSGTRTRQELYGMGWWTWILHTLLRNFHRDLCISSRDTRPGVLCMYVVTRVL